jgi:hypothetical protein
VGLRIGSGNFATLATNRPAAEPGIKYGESAFIGERQRQIYEVAMRFLLFILGIWAGVVGWKSRRVPGALGGENCGFTTFQQFLDNVSGIGF